MGVIRCVIRKVPVEAHPEELVRQKLLHQMLGPLEYPAGLIAVEKGLAQMPHLKLTGQSIPTRRADIIVFGKGIHPEFDLYPLLLIECKAVKLTQKAKNQVAGYNHYLKSFFIAIANDAEVQTAWFDAKQSKYQWAPRLPSYPQLMQAISKCPA